MDSASERGALQRAVVERFANVSALDLSTVQRALDDILGKVGAAIRFMAFFTLAAGLVVLLGSLATSRAQRLRETVLLKTLGASRAQVARVAVAEYLALGLLVGAGGRCCWRSAPAGRSRTGCSKPPLRFPQSPLAPPGRRRGGPDRGDRALELGGPLPATPLEALRAE